MLRALYVCGVDDIDNGIGLVVEDEVTGNDLLLGIRRHRINTRKVRNYCIRVSDYGTVLAVHSNAREVSDVLVGTRQTVK